MSLDLALARIEELRSMMPAAVERPAAVTAPAGSTATAPGSNAASFATQLADAQKMTARGVPSANGFTWPAEGPHTGSFGEDRGDHMHSGLDIAAPAGAPARAAQAGTVKSAGVNGGYGNLVVVEHPDGTETYYAHLQRMDVRPGQAVQAGQPVGAVGSTGRSTGPHLHFEVRKNGTPVNPLDYLPKR